MKRGGSRMSSDMLKKLKTEEIVICVLLVILVALVVYYIYQNNTMEGFDAHGKDKHTLYFFYTDWCGYSQRAQPVISDLQKVVDDYNVEIKSVDCDQEKKLAKEFDIRAYPTIVLKTKDGVRKDYEDSVELEKLKKWLSSVTK